LLIAERQVRLQELLARRGMIDLDSLSSELRVSQSTVRRDVDALVHRGVVKRTHGGVIWIGDRNSAAGVRPYAFDQRMEFRVDLKRQIARAAKQLVRPGETILLDGGTTTYYFAQELLGLPLQLVTNSLPISNLFLNDDNVELILTGGLMYPRYGVLLGPTAENVLSTIHTKSLFMSVAGIYEGTLYNQNVLLVQAEQRMMQQAQQVVLLVDSEKFGQQALAKLCPLSEIDVVVTDSSISSIYREQIEEAGVRVIVAEDVARGNGEQR
jgi:DeoR family fructose operon transcriptional repressor